MPIDIDYLWAKQEIESLEALLEKLPHGKRKEISDDIIEFVSKMEAKYGDG